MKRIMWAWGLIITLFPNLVFATPSAAVLTLNATGSAQVYLNGNAINTFAYVARGSSAQSFTFTGTQLSSLTATNNVLAVKVSATSSTSAWASWSLNITDTNGTIITNDNTSSIVSYSSACSPPDPHGGWTAVSFTPDTSWASPVDETYAIQGARIIDLTTGSLLSCLTSSFESRIATCQTLWFRQTFDLATAQTPTPEQPNFTISKSAKPSSGILGNQSITFTLGICNSGGGAGADVVTVKDVFIDPDHVFSYNSILPSITGYIDSNNISSSDTGYIHADTSGNTTTFTFEKGFPAYSCYNLIYTINATSAVTSFGSAWSNMASLAYGTQTSVATVVLSNAAAGYTRTSTQSATPTPTYTATPTITPIWTGTSTWTLTTTLTPTLTITPTFTTVPADKIYWTQLTSNAGWGVRDKFGASSLNGTFYVYGGTMQDNPYYNDVWSSTNGVTWSSVTTQAWPQVAGYMIGRSNFGYTNYNNNIWVVGGRILSNDVMSNPTTQSGSNTIDGSNWTNAEVALSASVDTPGLISYNGKLWLLGGGTNTVYNYDGTWHHVCQYVNPHYSKCNADWSARQSFGITIFNSRMWVAGGSAIVGSGTAYYNDVWSSTDGINWTEATASAPFVATDTINLFAYGTKMFAYIQATQELWSTTDGASWTIATTSATKPNAKRESAFTVIDNKLYLFGGYEGTDKNDVWVGAINPTMTPTITPTFYIPPATATMTAISTPFIQDLGQIKTTDGNSREIQVQKYPDYLNPLYVASYGATLQFRQFMTNDWSISPSPDRNVFLLPNLKVSGNYPLQLQVQTTNPATTLNSNIITVSPQQSPTP
jgi:hypothetical protein